MGRTYCADQMVSSLKIIYSPYKKVIPFNTEMDMQGSHMVQVILLNQFLGMEEKNILSHKSHGKFWKGEHDQLILNLENILGLTPLMKTAT